MVFALFAQPVDKNLALWGRTKQAWIAKSYVMGWPPFTFSSAVPFRFAAQATNPDIKTGFYRQGCTMLSNNRLYSCQYNANCTLNLVNSTNIIGIKTLFSLQNWYSNMIVHENNFYNSKSTDNLSFCSKSLVFFALHFLSQTIFSVLETPQPKCIFSFLFPNKMGPNTFQIITFKMCSFQFKPSACFTTS